MISTRSLPAHLIPKPFDAGVVLDGVDDVVAVLPSSPHVEGGAPDVRGGDPERKRAKDQERWERRQAARAAEAAGAPVAAPGRPRLEADGTAEATVVRLGRERQTRAAARAAADGVSLAELVRRAVDAYLGRDSDNDGAIRVVAAAMALAATGLPRQRIADILGVSRSTVYRLLQVRDRLAAVVAGIDEASAAFDARCSLWQ